MSFNTESAKVAIYCRKTVNQISFSCDCYLDFHDISDLMYFFENTMDTDAARTFAYDFEMFHGHVDYDRALIDSTEDNDLLRKISDKLNQAGYDLTIYNITYE